MKKGWLRFLVPGLLVAALLAGILSERVHYENVAHAQSGRTVVQKCFTVAMGGGFFNFFCTDNSGNFQYTQGQIGPLVPSPAPGADCTGHRYQVGIATNASTHNDGLMSCCGQPGGSTTLWTVGNCVR